ncbi:MAG TPA: diguanylate cyclase [Vicinamibacteria bacterium]|nr:diguanylate cyclase [Vicinamibacteria bacterium]
MSADWEEELAELRKLYLREVGVRLDDLGRVLDLLDRDGADEQALQELRRGFHGFAGSGTTYGLPGVSALGLEGERRCTAVRAGPAVEADVRAWREGLAAVRREIQSAADGGTAAASASGAEADESVANEPVPIVLIVDENEADRQSLVRALEQDAFAVRAAAPAEAAEELAAGALPDALIVAVGKEPSSALALITRVRARPGGDRPVVFVVSAQAGVLDRVEAIHCGADGHFSKPIDVGALARRLHFRLERERAEPPRILSMEDDLQQSAFLRTVFSSAGYEFRAVEDPARLEAELAAFRPDLVLMDVILPGVSGYDLVRSLRQDERYATLPVIVLTTRGEMESRIEAARAGGDEHLVKPVSPALLLSTVASRVERGRFLRLLVERDGLTGLLTHTALIERARAALAKKRRDPHRQWTWMMIDVDHFKAVNDTHGHPTGDQVHVRRASLLRARLRQADVVGRYGGEEFAVVLEDITGADAVRLVERLRAEFAAIAHRSRDGQEFGATFSAGLAPLEDGEALPAWVTAADRALYAAKLAGRDRVVLAPARP